MLLLFRDGKWWKTDEGSSMLQGVRKVSGSRPHEEGAASNCLQGPAVHNLGATWLGG